jgi:hypothetical protein
MIVEVTATVHTQVQPIQLPVKLFSHVHNDIVGPLPASPGGCTHLPDHGGKEHERQKQFPWSTLTQLAVRPPPSTAG